MNENGHSADLHLSTEDELLSLAVREAISRSEPIRMSSMDLIHVQASAGKVVLTGIAGSEALRYVAGQLAAGVSGVVAVENRLMAREAVERKVAVELASAEETRHLRINVHVAEDAVCLHGAVASQQEADAAVRVAARAAGTLAVRNEIEVVPEGRPIMILEQHSVEGRPVAAPEAADSERVSEPTGEAATRTGNPPASMVGGTA